jgi:hypothetical protein
VSLDDLARQDQNLVDLARSCREIGIVRGMVDAADVADRSGYPRLAAGIRTRGADPTVTFALSMVDHPDMDMLDVAGSRTLTGTPPATSGALWRVLGSVIWLAVTLSGWVALAWSALDR